MFAPLTWRSANEDSVRNCPTLHTGEGGRETKNSSSAAQRNSDSIAKAKEQTKETLLHRSSVVYGSVIDYHVVW